MNKVTSLILRRMRAPFILLISAYAVAIVGMILIPGVDDQGNVWHMSLFHAFYFVSFTATTIGFGEIPYPLTDGQRLWALFTVYMTVISWVYALGKILSLIQDKTFKNAVALSHFEKDVRIIHRPFYLVCGMGETGSAVVNALTEEHYRAVVVERDLKNLSELKLNELQEYVPSIAGDASEPEILELAGIRHPRCKGVIAVTASDETNLKIAITSKLLHPDIEVACRAEFKDSEINMRSFGTEHVVNPYETFAEIFSMVMHSPSLHLIFDWLTGIPNTKLTDPIYFNYGTWILCGYGRFGKELYKHLKIHNIPTTIIDPVGELKTEFDADPDNKDNRFIVGPGYDEETLRKAGAENAAGLIAGSDNDSNNLSTIMTARDINPHIFIVARHNKWSNHVLYSSTHASLIMHPREIIARKIRALYLTPLLTNFLEQAKQQDQEWSNITISRLTAVVGESRPHVWTAELNQKDASAVHSALAHGRRISLKHITQDPGDRNAKLKCVPILLARGGHEILMPEDDCELKIGDKILLCGTREVKNNIQWTLSVARSLNYVMSYTTEPESYVWRKIYRYRHKHERRNRPR